MNRTNKELLSTPLWKMSGSEFMTLIRVTIGLESENDDTGTDVVGLWSPSSAWLPDYAYGQDELCRLLELPLGFVEKLSRMNLLDHTVERKVGRRRVYNVKEVMKVIDNYRKAHIR